MAGMVLIPDKNRSTNSVQTPGVSGEGVSGVEDLNDGHTVRERRVLQHVQKGQEAYGNLLMTLPGGL